MPNQKCNPLCPPFIIYIILSVVSLLSTIINTSSSITTKLISVSSGLVSMALFGALFYWLCYTCHKTIAWVILLIPVIVFLLLLVFSLGLLSSLLTNAENKKSNEKK